MGQRVSSRSPSHPNLAPRAVGSVLLLAGALILLAACTSVRPVVKIGLLAPFEGLYREDGYAALHGLRTAIAECAPAGMDLLPLALDDSADPQQAQRAAQKLLDDPTVQAVIGPFDLASAVATQTVLAATTWVTPFHLQPAVGFIAADAPLASAWLAPLVAAIQTTAAAERVLLLGLPSNLAADSTRATIPNVLTDEPAHALAIIRDGDAVLWLGDPAQGAAWLTELRRRSDAPFFLGTPYGAAIFAAHAPREAAAYWMLWQDVEYNRWSETHAPASTPIQANTTYVTYRAACAAMARLTHAPSPSATAWQVQAIEFPVEK